MANFNTHISVAFVASGVSALVLFKAGLLTGGEFVLCTLVGTLGGLLPDIDLEHSVPARIGFNVVSLLTAFGLVIYWAGVLSLVSLMLVWLLTYLMMRYGVFNIFSELTTHRGVVHSLPFLAICGLLVTYVSFYGLKYAVSLSWFLGLFVFFGSLVHLILDEIYSVNVFGLKLKRSFGTALKLFDPQHKKLYLILYGIMGLLVIFSPPFTLFWQALTEPTHWQGLAQDLLPKSTVLSQWVDQIRGLF